MDLLSVYEKIVNAVEDGVYIVDENRQIQFWNKGAENITGYTAQEVIGSYCHENLLNHIDLQGRPLCLLGCPLLDTICDNQNRFDQVFLQHKQGYRVQVSVKIFAIQNEQGVTTGAVEVFSPNAVLHESRQLVDSLAAQAMTDKLTNLPNRVFLESALHYRLVDYRKRQALFGVLFMDVDNFSAFNNNYGHEVGDAVLKGIGASVRKALRESDLFGRWGGEEFLGIFSFPSAEEASIVAEKVLHAVRQASVLYGGEQLSVTASIGMALANQDDTVDNLVQRADTYMYQAKGSGKNCVVVESR